jgi:hypothetical protein
VPKSNIQNVVEDTAAQADADAVMMAADFSEAPPAEVMKSAEDQAAMDNLIARKVAEGIAAAMPAVLAQIAMTQSAEQQFAAGMGPSSAVNMKVGGDVQAKASYLKHYRLDEAINGKHQLLDVSKLDENGDFIVEEIPGGKLRIPAIRKGEYVNFVGGHFYATRQIEVDFIEHLMKTDPMCKIYESAEGNLIPCGELNCSMYFATEDGVIAHRRATHGLR